MGMKIVDTAIPDVKLIEPAVFDDERGFFYESHNHRRFEEALGRKVDFVQDNHARSLRGVLRGLHYQMPPHAQGKLARVARGEVYDVAVDVRRSSPTFGKWVGAMLTEENRRQVWIPEGFAHAYVVVSEYADFLYKTTDYWFKELERVIQWNDPQLNIAWPTGIEPRLSEKDAQASSFARAEVFG
jgi:dTDP-4-dehydrorhamnose 3,5-epimerase